MDAGALIEEFRQLLILRVWLRKIESSNFLSLTEKIMIEKSLLLIFRGVTSALTTTLFGSAPGAEHVA